MRVAAYCVLAVAVLLVLTLLAGMANAAECAPRDAVVKYLADDWDEVQTSVMLDARGRVYEVYASEAGTWTIPRTTPDGVSCIMSSGVAYEAAKGVTGDPA